MNDIKKVVSFSGGRTSAYLCHLMKKKYGDDVDFVFMDTGAEHPKTYEFIREVNSHFNLNLTCLRAVVHPELGKGNSYEVISIDDIKCDLNPWRDMLKKYGTPYCPGGECCTDKMKLIPYKKYLNDKYGRNNHETYLGIRIDEPKRLKLRKNIVYLGDISFVNKYDILCWWKKQSFDLELKEHLGNCIFCIKKDVKKLALAAKYEPEMASEFWNMLNHDSVRVVERRIGRSLEMYRGRKNLAQIILEFSEYSRDNLEYLVSPKQQRHEMQPQLFEV